MHESALPAPQPLYQRVRDALRADILSGALAVHERLPSESELVQRHQVSRITVRHALLELHREGLIVRLQGKGAFVAPVQTARPLQRLQGLGESLRASGHSVQNRRLSFRSLRADAEVAKRLGLALRAPVMRLVSLRYVDRRPVSLNRSWYPAAIGERLSRIDLAARDIIDVLERDLGLQVHGADVEISATTWPDADARWVGQHGGQAALRVARVLRSVDGQALQFESVLHPAEEFSLHLTLAR
jgi:GntR family transcriptional regulator